MSAHQPPVARIVDPQSTLALVLWTGFVGSFALGAVGRQLIWLLGLIGLWQLLSHGRHVVGDTRVRQFFILLMLMVIPGMLAQVDAFAFDRSGRTLFRFCWYGLAAIPLFMNPLAEQQHKRFLTGCAALVLFFIADGLLQRQLGSNLIGAPLFDDGRYALRVTGFLGVDYGWTLACLSPFVLFASVQWDTRVPVSRVLGLTVPLLVVILYFSGSRASMVLLMVGLAGFAMLAYFDHPAPGSRLAPGPGRAILFAIPFLAVVVWFLLVMVMGSSRWQAILGLFYGESGGLNTALSLRPVIWGEAWRVFSEHWINGVGLRGFTDLAAPILQTTEGLPVKSRGWSPHLVLLEVATSTGIIGVVCYLSAYGMFMRWLIRKSRSVQAAGLTGLLALFPFGSTLPFYSAQVAGLGWMMIVVALALDTSRRPLFGEKSLCAV